MDKEISKCPICGEVVNISRPVAGSNNATTFKYYECPRCGIFRMMDWTGIDQYRESLFLVSAWIREQSRMQFYPPFLVPDCDGFTNDMLRNTLQGSSLSMETPYLAKPTDPVGLVKSLTIPSVTEKQLKLMQSLEKGTKYPGMRISLIDTASKNGIRRDLIAKSWCKNEEELHFYIESLGKRGLLEISPTVPIPSAVLITAKGWDFLETNRHKNRKDSKKVFVAMWFHESMDSTYNEAIAPATKEAGYVSFRVDRVEYIDKIDDKIIANIRSSKFLIADFSGQRNSVYYETGFAQGLGIPVILCVRKKDAKCLSFDTRQYNYIIWEDKKDLKGRLIDRIKALFGQYPGSD